MVEDAWDQVELNLDPGRTIAEVKSQALALTHRRNPGSEYLVKFRGAELQDEGRSLTESGVVPNGALIVMSRRRHPVR
jgi:hypothetical protein